MPSLLCAPANFNARQAAEVAATAHTMPPLPLQVLHKLRGQAQVDKLVELNVMRQVRHGGKGKWIGLAATCHTGVLDCHLPHRSA